MDNPGPRYRKTPHGWEPLDAFRPASPVRLSGQEIALRWIQEVIDCGVPPKRAVKYWGYLIDATRRRATQ